MDNSVLLVGNFLSRHIGVRGVCEELAERLSQAGWSVITTSDRASKGARIVDMMRTAWSQRARYNIAHVDLYSGPAFFWAEAVCWTLRAAHKPYVLTLHGGGLPDFASKWRNRCVSLLRSAKAVTAPSNYLLEQMRPYREDVRLLPNALEVSRYPFRLRLKAEPRIVWVRAFDYTYNPVLAVRMMSEVRKSHPEARLLMVGPDKADGSFAATKAEVARLGLTSHIEFTGPVPKKDIPTWINKGDIFINTTNVDNTPVTVLEALACGACVVSTNVGGIPYMLSGGVDSLLVPPDDPGAMAAAVSRLLHEPGLAASMSREGRKKAEKIDWPLVLNQWISLLSSQS